MTAPTLRPYQTEAIQAVLAARKAGVRRLLVALPTGAGKTVIFAALCRLAQRPVLVLAHREELVQQARHKISTALGDSGQVGVEQASQRAPDGVKVVVASIRSLRSERLQQLRARFDFGLVIYDECHHAPADDNVRVLRELGCLSPQWSGTLLGVTATTQRGDGEGLDKVFERVVYYQTLPDLIGAGYLAPLRGYRIATTADLSAVRPVGDDLELAALAEAVDLEERNALVARSIQELARDRRTIAFCVTVGHARNLALALRKLGVRAGVVHGELPRQERAAVLDDFAQERLQVICNVAVLTEGFDDPGVSCVAMARPTRSAGLYAQCIGRGTRLAPGKTDCLILDFADVSSLDLCTLPSLYGMPRQIDLQGERADDAKARWDRIVFDHQGFELEAAGITLDEVQTRAAAFDPLTRDVDAEVRALSALGWVSLGKHGVCLHVHLRPGQVSELAVRPVAGRGKRWGVFWEGQERARFSKLEDAVAAVDWEVEQKGPRTWQSALPDAEWRKAQVTPALREALDAVRSPRRAQTVGEALHLLALSAAVHRLAPARPALP